MIFSQFSFGGFGGNSWRPFNRKGRQNATSDTSSAFNPADSNTLPPTTNDRAKATRLRLRAVPIYGVRDRLMGSIEQILAADVLPHLNDDERNKALDLGHRLEKGTTSTLPAIIEETCVFIDAISMPLSQRFLMQAIKTLLAADAISHLKEDDQDTVIEHGRLLQNSSGTELPAAVFVVSSFIEKTSELILDQLNENRVVKRAQRDYDAERKKLISHGASPNELTLHHARHYSTLLSFAVSKWLEINA